MVLGLRSGTVELAEHDPGWKVNAALTIRRLWDIFGELAVDIQHIGSTAVPNIKAKPVIDIAVLVHSFDNALSVSSALEENGFHFQGWEGQDEKQPHFMCGEYDAANNKILVLTHYREVIRAGSNLVYHPGKERFVTQLIQAADKWDEMGRKLD